jgi:ElaA protein
MDWKCCEFWQLSSVELYQILHARNAILIVEDAHMHQEIDGKDHNAVHIFALDATTSDPSVVAYARLRPGDEIDPETVIDKVLTHTTHRDDDTAEHLVAHALAVSHDRWPHAPVRTHSPVHRESFYKRLGFRKIDGPFLQHGMPFIGMIRPPIRAPKSISNPLRAARASATNRAAGAEAPRGSDHMERSKDSESNGAPSLLDPTLGVNQ